MPRASPLKVLLLAGVQVYKGGKVLAASIRGGLPGYREEIKFLIHGGEYIIVELLIEGRHTGPMNGMEPTG